MWETVSMKIQAVLFDLGETLINFGQVNAVAIFKQGGELAYNFLRGLNQPTGPLSLFLLRHLLIIRFFQLLSAVTGRDFDSFELLKKTERMRGVSLTDEQWRQFGWLWYEPLSRLGSIEPDLSQTLEKLKAAGFKLGILSNTFVNAFMLERHLEQFNLSGYFSVRLYSYQFKFRKPNRKIFIDAAQMIGCLPENVLYVGDRLDNDVAGALKANMTPVLKRAYTNSGKTIPQNVPVIENLSELPTLISRINQG
ncbi:MAG: HAD family hydrolase [Phycisphaerae bacterium]|jgi:HAD superfamily hydrolase (TIGR01549 family)